MKTSKNKIANFFKIGILLLGFSLSLLYSCKKENDFSINQKNITQYSKPIISKSNFNELKNDALFSDLVKQLQLEDKTDLNPNLQRKKQEGELILSSSVIKKVVIGNKTSYNILAKRQGGADNVIENVVLQNINGQYRSLLIKYTLKKTTKSSKSHFHRNSLDVELDEVEIDDYGDAFGGGGTRGKNCKYETIFIEFSCSGPGSAGNHFRPSQCECGKRVRCNPPRSKSLSVEVCETSNGDINGNWQNHIDNNNNNNSNGAGGLGSSSAIITSQSGVSAFTYQNPDGAVSLIAEKLDLNQKHIDFLNNSEGELVSDILNLLDTSKGKKFAKELIALQMTLNNQLQVKQTGSHPEELNGCCPGNCCPNHFFYDNDKIIKEYGVQPVKVAVDGTFNVLIATASLIGSEKWVGRNVRKIMSEIGMNVPSDVTNEHLAAIFKIRKRNGVVIVEYREGILRTMLDFGLNTLDMIAFLSPSKGGGAFLASKIGGITITKMTAHLRKISINNTKVDDIVNSLNPKAKFDLNGTGPNSVVKGHHPLAKSAFRSDKFYDLKKAFSVSKSLLEKYGGKGVHNLITGQQNSLYSAFAKTGEVLTLDKMAQIEIKAMTNKGIPEDIATGWVIKALQDLKSQGVKIITHIPWNGIN